MVSIDSKKLNGNAEYRKVFYPYVVWQLFNIGSKLGYNNPTYGKLHACHNQQFTPLLK